MEKIGNIISKKKNPSTSDLTVIEGFLYYLNQIILLTISGESLS